MALLQDVCQVFLRVKDAVHPAAALEQQIWSFRDRQAGFLHSADEATNRGVFRDRGSRNMSLQVSSGLVDSSGGRLNGGSGVATGICGVKFLGRNVQDSASPLFASDCNSNSVAVQSTTTVASKVPSSLQARSGDSCQPPIFPGDAFVRRDELLKPDVMSEVILLGAGALVFAILILILVVALTQTSAPV
jgi:hypothetical protein